jgi:hypothetical protein
VASSPRLTQRVPAPAPAQRAATRTRREREVDWRRIPAATVISYRTHSHRHLGPVLDTHIRDLPVIHCDRRLAPRLRAMRGKAANPKSETGRENQEQAGSKTEQPF